MNGRDITSTIHDHANCRVGERIGLVPDLKRAHLFDAANGQRLAA